MVNIIPSFSCCNNIMKGSLIWNLQRYSSLVILCYLIYIFSFIFFSENKINFFEWSEFFLSFQSRFFTSIVFLFLVLHAFIGLWTIGTDYLTERTLGFLNRALSERATLLRSLYFMTFGFLGFMYLFLILYIIWT